MLCSESLALPGNRCGLRKRIYLKGFDQFLFAYEQVPDCTMEFKVSLSRHVAMICGRPEILKSFAVILTIVLADVTVKGKSVWQL